MVDKMALLGVQISFTVKVVLAMFIHNSGGIYINYTGIKIPLPTNLSQTGLNNSEKSKCKLM